MLAAVLLAINARHAESLDEACNGLLRDGDHGIYRRSEGMECVCQRTSKVCQRTSKVVCRLLQRHSSIDLRHASRTQIPQYLKTMRSFSPGDSKSQSMLSGRIRFRPGAGIPRTRASISARSVFIGRHLLLHFLSVTTTGSRSDLVVVFNMMSIKQQQIRITYLSVLGGQAPPPLPRMSCKQAWPST